MNPTAEQLANRLNPTPSTFNVPSTEGLFRARGDFGTAVYRKAGNRIEMVDLVKAFLPDNAERASIGDYGSQATTALQRLKSQYGLDWNSLPEYNFGDLMSQADKMGLQVAQRGVNGVSYVFDETGNIRSFLGARETSQPSQVTVNNTPNAIATPEQIAEQMKDPNWTSGAGKTLPDTSQPQQQAPQAQPNAPQQNQAITAPTQPAPSYTIQSGDTLSKIAQQYGTTVGQLMSINPQITDANKIYTGQKLNLAPQVQGGQNVQTGQVPQGMVDQAQAIQAEIDKMTSPANTGVPQEPKTQTGKTETQNIVDTWQKVSEELGLSDIKKAYEKTLADSKEVEDKKAEEASKINNNPWYSEGKRQLELRKLESKYETKLNTLSNYAKLYDSMYQEGRDTAEFLTTGIQKDQQFALELAQKKQEALDKLMEQDIRPMSINGREVLVDLKSQTIVADLGASKVGGDSIGSLPTSYKEWELAGGQAGTGKSYSQWVADANVKSPTVQQQTVAEYAARIEQSEPTLNSLEKAITGMNLINFTTQISLPAALQSSTIQQYMQAARNFINAKLRRESGAVISPTEFSEARQQYLPQPGDSAETLVLKKANRDLVFASLKNAAGTAYQSVDELLDTQGQTTNWATDYNYTRDIEQARQAIQQGADEGAVRARLLTKYKEVNL